MDKIRQFSFQDYIVSKNSEITLDSIDSTLSSCCNKNQQRHETGTSHGMDNYLYTQSTQNNSNFASENLFTFKDQDDETERTNRESKKVPDATDGKETVDGLSCYGKSEENWKKIDKINKMLEEHRKKKVFKKVFTPLSRVDENAGLNEIDMDMSQLPSERTNTAQFLNIDKGYGPRSIVTEESDLTSKENENSGYLEASTNNKGEEKLEQQFATLNRSLRNITISNDIQNQKNQPNNIIEKQGPATKRSESAKSLGYNKKTKPNSISCKENINSGKSQENGVPEKKLPIEERLRLKNIEREIKLTQLREQKLRKEMKSLRSKPKISENSNKIISYSRRAIDNEEIFEKLSLSDVKKSKIVGGSLSGLDVSQSHGPLSEVRNDKSFRAESMTESSQNIYKRSRRQPSITITSSSRNNFEACKPLSDIISTIEGPQDDEKTQTNASSKQDDSLGLMLSLRPSSSDSNLHRAASERLKMAMARKITFQKRDESLRTESSLFSTQAGLPVAAIEKNKESSQAYQIPQPGACIDEYHNTDHGSIETVRSPKQVYLKMSDKAIEEYGIQNDIPVNCHQSKQHLPYAEPVNQKGEQSLERAEPYKENKEFGGDVPKQQNAAYDSVDSKKSSRQLTFGTCSNRKLSILSSIDNFHLENPHQNGYENQNNQEGMRNNEEKEKENTPKSSGRQSHESLLNSWRLRQQKFSKSGEYTLIGHKKNIKSSHGLQIRDSNQTPQASMGTDKLWEDFDIYLRNTMWLSAKNSKISTLSLAKEQQGLKECTFRPNIGDRSSRLAIMSPRDNFQSPSDLVSARSKSKSNESCKNIKLISYKDLHSKKDKLCDSNQGFDHASSVHDLPKSNRNLNINNNFQIEMGEVNGQKLFLV